MTVLRLVRFPNLLVVALTQWLAARWVLGRAYVREEVEPVFNSEELFFLILATLCITAAGYVLNDILDRNIDRINRPERVIIGEVIHLGTACWLVAVLVFSGFLAALLLAFYKSELDWLWLYPAFAILLGAYSRHLKSRPFLGNLFIAFCCAGTAGLVWLAERSAWRQLSVEMAKEVSQVLTLFMVYAFLVTWIREIVKDYEDYVGDAEQGRVTVPVYLGLRGGKRLVILLTVILSAALSAVLWLQQGLIVNLVVVALATTAAYLTFRFRRARMATEYGHLSYAWKFFLLGGLLLLYLF